MNLHKLLATSTFRLALVYLAIFATSAFALLAFLYWGTTGFMAAQTDETIEAEITGLAEQYVQTGLPGLRQIILARSAESEVSIYLLANGDRSRIAGNLTTWPEGPPTPNGWIDFLYERPTPNGPVLRPARARRFVLPGNFLLLVGRDIGVRRQVEDRITTALGWAGALTVALGLLGGFLFSRNMVSRLDAINRTSREIMAGDLTRRVPLLGNNDELDELAKSLNSMLDQIERLMASMRDVADNIAHDLRSPLNRLRSRIEMALLHPGDPKAAGEVLEGALVEIDGVITTFNALLLIAEAESGALPETQGDVDLAGALRDIVELYEPVAEAKGLTVQAAAREPMPVTGHGALINQALANLVDNAIKYTPEGGVVRLAAYYDAGHPTISVEDSGPGIPGEDRARVLERFVRLERSRHEPGSGLGLSLVAAVARLHRADLTLGDAGPGLRVTIRFPLPRLSLRGARPSALPAPSAAAQTQSS
ncbi:MAG: HAMP domain-containing protein [Alphaproteobacteria bacterium]|nr:HAMP domain-containing protein [Alphaproteobacteria bacterium]